MSSLTSEYTPCYILVMDDEDGTFIKGAYLIEGDARAECEIMNRDHGDYCTYRVVESTLC